MNILLAGQAYYRRDNGQAVFTINLAEGLASAGHHVLVLAPSATRRSERWQERGVQIQTVPTLPLFKPTVASPVLTTPALAILIVPAPELATISP